ncbi:branched-chain amino acid ABC transporter permease [Bosea sp. (in: a-proteobacteria)]|uniref:branched-chain amino acid ABC transporter permease n=1 Tax=Bosea sp. (in: a-proteobacteria) TaxID=1871050 RepID=UPI00261683CE|nr:branched-chain amino acid ABC transporter permease [Bosea sp. (in: a-proteobacteria)]MCO5090595.1 branched-chain amino acid ABC transporter permease [Bosea sp. (in: a-proteobacteria)]
MDYIYSIIILVSLSIIMASSFNLSIGYGGLISIAHPVFYAIGAYASALLARNLGVPVPLAMLAGTAVAVACSLFLALSSLRVSGDYLMIASIGFQLGVLELIKNMAWTGGAGGLTNIPAFLTPTLGRLSYVVLVVLVAMLVVFIVNRIAHGPAGRALSAMRDDELAFSSLGRDATGLKLGVFALSSGLAGFAGSLYAHYFRYLTPEQFDVLQSAALLTMIVVGGIRSTWGPVVGAVILQVLPQAITFLDLPTSVLGPLQGFLFTGLVLVFMFVRPQGLVAAGDVWRSHSATVPHGRHS